MVLRATRSLTKAYESGVCGGPITTLNIANVNNLTLQNIFAKLCKACQINTMASIPPSAFSAGRIRETQAGSRDLKISAGKPEVTKFFNTTFMELSPLKYNSKLMNSIWGLYNRYSPHNVKKINDALVFDGESQQAPCAATNKNEPKISLQAASLDKVWASINVPQSH